MSVDLANLPEAKRIAKNYTADLLKEFDGDVFAHDFTVEVTDAFGLLLFVIVVSGIVAPAVKA